MKNFLKSALLLTAISILTLTSCQTEEMQTTTDENVNLTNSSPLKGLLSRVAQGATSADNVIDNSSCFSVNLPVTVVTNNQQVVISDATGYATVQNILNEFDDDNDQVTIIFPITITFANLTTAVVINADQLDDIIDDCGMDNDFDEIECLNINYPINVSFYNAGTQTPSTITINSDVALYNFFDNFDDDDYVTINYPISVIVANGSLLAINNNNELAAAIQTAELNCNSNDDDDFDDDDDDNSNNTPIAANFLTTIQSGTWEVSYFMDDTNQTANYTTYNFTFNANGSISIVSGATTFTGQWLAYVDNNENTFEIDFPSVQLEELSDDWEIIEYSPTQIRLKDVSSGNGATDFLTFTKN